MESIKHLTTRSVLLTASARSSSGKSDPTSSGVSGRAFLDSAWGGMGGEGA